MLFAADPRGARTAARAPAQAEEMAKQGGLGGLFQNLQGAALAGVALASELGSLAAEKGLEVAYTKAKELVEWLEKRLKRQQHATASAIDGWARTRNHLVMTRCMGNWINWYWRRRTRITTKTITFTQEEREPTAQACDDNPAVSSLGIVPICINPKRLLQGGDSLDKIVVSRSEARELRKVGFPTFNTEKPPTRLPALSAQYLCWRKSMIMVSIVFYVIVLVLRLIQMSTVTSSADAWEAPAPVHVRGPSNTTFVVQFPGASDVLSDETEQRVQTTRWVLEVIDFVSQVLLVIWLCFAYKYWRWFRWSRRAALYAWCAANLLRFLIFYVPWLSYVPPEMFASDGCTWALKQFTELFRVRYDKDVAAMFGTSIDRICDESEPVSELAQRTVLYSAEFAGAAAVQECIKTAERMRPVCDSLSALPNVPGLPTAPATVAGCIGAVEVMVTVTCFQLPTGSFVNATVATVGQAVELAATAIEVIPYLALLLKALSLLVLPSLGLVMGVAKGALNVKKLVPQRRLPGLLLVLFTACVVPWCALVSVCFVAAIGNVVAALAAFFLTASQMVFCPLPGRLIAPVDKEQLDEELGKRGMVRLGLMLVAVVMLLVAVQTAPHLGPEVLGGVATAAMGSKLVMVTIMFGVFAGYFFSQLVFTDLVLNMTNEVYVRPRGDMQAPDSVGEHMRARSEARLVELSVLFPRDLSSRWRPFKEERLDAPPEEEVSPDSPRIVQGLVHVRGKCLALLFGSRIKGFDYHQQVANMVQENGPEPDGGVPRLVTLIPDGVPRQAHQDAPSSPDQLPPPKGSWK
eukprot:TRINITY_DN47354_c0_g1_i1.p1 TRINITY_DN47354_c0_g1~~TRINITY_DN47354_c0_g1_i1.p1  ORF type:complete len:805 (+),score=162.84 TRINITY_DN47354_c0_g1_i1:50-2464(+)